MGYADSDFKLIRAMLAIKKLVLGYTVGSVVVIWSILGYADPAVAYAELECDKD